MVIKNKWERKSLIGLEELSEEEINLLLDKAKYFKKIKIFKKIPESLAGKRLSICFLNQAQGQGLHLKLLLKALMRI